MSYRKLVDPEQRPVEPLDRETLRLGDRKARPVYVYDETVKLALNVALATGRPLLVSGEPGTGKSSLAYHLEATFGWRLYGRSISSHTQAQDLQWSFDAVRRLNDAQAHEVRPRPAYVEPGVLWWAFDRQLARRRGLSEERFSELGVHPAVDPCADNSSPQAIVLLDELDKADPDVPNDLLEPLASYRFRIDDVGIVVEAKKLPLVLITTNEERDLPRAFLRRCVSLRLEPPDDKKLLRIAAAHFPDGDPQLHEAIAVRFLDFRKNPGKTGVRPPSTAEYLDAISACRVLRITPDSPEWNQIASLTLLKQQGVGAQ